MENWVSQPYNIKVPVKKKKKIFNGQLLSGKLRLTYEGCWVRSCRSLLCLEQKAAPIVELHGTKWHHSEYGCTERRLVQGGPGSLRPVQNPSWFLTFISVLFYIPLRVCYHTYVKQRLGGDHVKSGRCQTSSPDQDLDDVSLFRPQKQKLKVLSSDCLCFKSLGFESKNITAPWFFHLSGSPQSVLTFSSNCYWHFIYFLFN